MSARNYMRSGEKRYFFASAPHVIGAADRHLGGDTKGFPHRQVTASYYMAEQRDRLDPSPQKRPSQRQPVSEEQVRSRFLHFDVEVDLGKALLGGLLATLVSIAGTYVVGQASGSEWLRLVEAMLPSARFLCVAVMTASATILALMLTALGVSRQAPSPLRTSHYKRVEQIALLDTATFVLSTLLLLALTIPIGQQTTPLSSEWYMTAYYAILILSSLLGGMLVSVVLMLYGTIRDLIEVIGLERKDSPILFSEDDSSGED